MMFDIRSKSINTEVQFICELEARFAIKPTNKQLAEAIQKAYLIATSLGGDKLEPHNLGEAHIIGVDFGKVYLRGINSGDVDSQRAYLKGGF